MSIKQKLNNIEQLIKQIQTESDLQTKIDLYKNTIDDCNSTKKEIEKQKNKFHFLQNNHTDPTILNKTQDNHNLNIYNILHEIESIYTNIKSDHVQIEDLPDFYKQSIHLKNLSQQFTKSKEPNINIISK